MSNDHGPAAAAAAPVEDPLSASREQSPSPTPSSRQTRHDAPARGSSPKAPVSRGWLSSVRRPRTSPGPRASPFKRSLLPDDDDRRDSALATSTADAHPDHAAFPAPSPTNIHKAPSLPAIVVQNDHRAHPGKAPTLTLGHATRGSFHGIDTIIPTGAFDDLTSPSQVSFSKRGSMLLGGKKANPNRMSRQLQLLLSGAGGKPGLASPIDKQSSQPTSPLAKEQKQEQEQEQEQHRTQQERPATPQQEQDQKQQTTSATATADTSLIAPTAPPAPSQYLSPMPRSPSRYSARNRALSNRVLSADETMLSRKVRTMYKHGNESAANWDGISEEDSSVLSTPQNGSNLSVTPAREDSASLRSSRRQSLIVKEPAETAGGVEDWTDLEGGEVDRYGFIIVKSSSQTSSGGDRLDTPEPRIQRVSTALQLVSEEPRRRGMRRTISMGRASRSTAPKTPSPLKRRPSKTQQSTMSNKTSRSTPQKSIRNAANRLPHNKDRRLMDEASDMLKLPPGLAELAEQEDNGHVAQAMKAKEIQREEKWRRMAKIVEGTKGGGMLFEFDVRDPKLIARTWKGIPDRWRATAWYAFLAASAKATKDSPTEEELFEAFYELQEESSADDLQIDVDVPRTINRHIMFRRRYRGGQRLLFRVLHAMSLYLPDTGYVQGMAALAATLLCYYEEDKAFVMLVRLWIHRGLERLYESGFTGLMEALEDFEQNWLRGGDIAKKLEEMCITSTAYGTRWYLTLFNYSLPFPAQLRVWDAFMLLGDISNANSPSTKFSGDLDVLHATSAALIDATRDILLDSDFENAMKVLTSWIPIKDEDLLMRVAKAEYKMRKKRANAT